jgi:hypothetical protein
MSTPHDPLAVTQPSKAGEAPQHDPRVPGGKTDEPDIRQDHPNKPFRTPNKTKTHPAPDCATDGEPAPRKD